LVRLDDLSRDQQFIDGVSGTRSVRRVRGLAARVRVGAADETLTGCGGVLAVTALTGRLGLVEALVDRLTFGGNIIQTGTDSYRLARTRTRIVEQRDGS